ncbi:MAG: V-type ATP synthase subunit D [Candidatus Omnitrophota bacterium]
MSKIRLTKNELKKQKEALKRFERYLPMLLLKKRQIRLETTKIHQAIKSVSQEIENFRNEVIHWVDVFAEDANIFEILKLESIQTDQGNVAGVDLPVFLGVKFKQQPYDLMAVPLWVDKAIESLKEMITYKARLLVYRKQLDILKEELRIAGQRVNLFEKVKIPEAKENIRILQIYLGEIRTAEVVRGKIAKAKIEKRKLVNA